MSSTKLRELSIVKKGSVAQKKTRIKSERYRILKGYIVLDLTETVAEIRFWNLQMEL